MLDRAQAAELVRDGSLGLFTITFTKNIFTAIVSLGAELDYTLLLDELQRTGKEIDWGALVRLDDGVVIEVPMAKRIGRLRELRRLRELARVGELLARAPFEYGTKSADLIAEVRSRLEGIEK